MNDHVSRIRDNLARLQERITAAAQRAAREPSEIRLVAVTKYVDVGLTRAVAEAGCLDLGESRPQALWDKAESLRDLPIRWHLVGHLQRNKVRRTCPWLHLLHSADSHRLLEELESWGAAQGRTTACLLEVNVSGDAAKHGLHPDDVPPLLAQLGQFPHVEVRGLMTMASLDRLGEAARGDFRALRDLRDHLPTGALQAPALPELSMGMSGDFEQAIEEGATLIRIGSALFTGLVDE